MRVGAVILAAGTSSRMGSNKLLANLRGKPVLTHVLDAVAGAGLPPPVVVLGHEADRVAAIFELESEHPHHLSLPRFARNHDYRLGMAHSLATGIRAAPDDWDACVVCLGDMPLVSAALLNALVAKSDSESIVAPVRDGRRGNPVVWPRRFFPDLAALTGDEGARGVISRNADRLTLVEWADDGIFQDSDTPEDLERLRSS